MDHASTMRKTYERINAGDITGFGDLVADDFVEHQGGGPAFPATKEGTLAFFRTLQAAFPDMRMTVEDLIAGEGPITARVVVVEDLGSETYVHAEIGDAPVIYRCGPASGVPAPGDTVNLGIREGRTHWFRDGARVPDET